MSNSDVKIISVEGNIGAGKSTLITRLQNYINYVIAFYSYEFGERATSLSKRIVFLKEPVDVWQNVKDKTNGKNILENFYENPDKWSFAFQVMVFTTQQQLIEDTLASNPECKMIICERSVEAGRNIFTQMLMDSGNINSLEYQIYDLLFKTHKYPLYASIFINIPPEICISRIRSRGRNGESEINIDYLNKCDYYYRNWLIEKREIYSSPELVYLIEDNELDTILPILFPLFEKFL